jgi:hypothetical protein
MIICRTYPKAGAVTDEQLQEVLDYKKQLRKNEPFVLDQNLIDIIYNMANM